MKKLIFIILVFNMFFFKSFASANYNKIFYDLQINSISGELMDFKKFKDKAILKSLFMFSVLPSSIADKTSDLKFSFDTAIYKKIPAGMVTAILYPRSSILQYYSNNWYLP